MSDPSNGDVFNGLMEENKKLSEELAFERNVNKVLENIRNNSLVLMQNCLCLSNEKIFNVIKQLNTIYTELKTKQSISELIKNVNQMKDQIEFADNQKNITKETNRSLDVSLQTEDSTVTQTTQPIGSKFSLITELLQIKDNCVSNDTNSVIDQIFKDEDNSNDIEIIEFNTNCSQPIDFDHRLSTGSSSEMSESMATSQQLSVQPAEDLSGEFICHLCHEICLQKLDLQKHLSEVHKVRGFECEFCDFNTSRSQDMKRHRKLHLNPLVCNLCNYKTSRLDHLKRHKKRHSSKKPIKCTIEECNKQFNNKPDIRQHINIRHSNLLKLKSTDNLFHCSVDGCDKRFRTLDKLFAHKHPDQSRSQSK